MRLSRMTVRHLVPRWVVATAAGTRPKGERFDMPRRAMIQGGAGLVTGAVIGGLDDRYSSFARPEPEPDPEPVEQEPVEEEPLEEEPPEEASPEPAEPVELRHGSGGEEVWALQERLDATGFWCGTADGGFGHLTQQAVWALQKTHGLYRDGIVGPRTREALATGTRPAPAHGGTHVEVHLASQLVLIVRGGSTVMTLNTSTGNGEPYEYEDVEYVAHTPTGDFAVWLTHSAGWRDGELGEMYRPMFYSGNYAIHGSESIPPWPASHGCARVSVQAMEMIWAEGLLGMGDRVVVV